MRTTGIRRRPGPGRRLRSPVPPPRPSPPVAAAGPASGSPRPTGRSCCTSARRSRSSAGRATVRRSRSTRRRRTRRWTASAPRSPTRPRTCSTGSARPPASRRMRTLFDPSQGIGVSFLRQPVGSSDFTAAAEHYTYDDVPAGQTDFGLRHFSIAHDQQQILPLLRRAKQLNPALKVMATPWSPPAWMKTADSLVGGRLKDDPSGLRRLRALPGEVRPGVREGRRTGRLPLRAERAAEPQAERATRARTCRCARRPR